MSIFVKHLQIIELPLAEIEADDFTLDWTIRWQPILFYLFLRIWGVLIIKRCEIKIIVVTWRIASRRHTVQNHLFSSLPLTSWRCKWELEKERKKERNETPASLYCNIERFMKQLYPAVAYRSIYRILFSPLFCRFNKNLPVGWGINEFGRDYASSAAIELMVR